MKKSVLMLSVLAFLIGVGGFVLYDSYFGERQRPVPPPEQREPLPEKMEVPSIRFPVPETAPEPPQAPAEQARSEAPPAVEPPAPLPELGESDSAARDALGALFDPSLLELLRVEFFIQRLVATVDNLPRRGFPSNLPPIKPPAGPFTASGEEGSKIISPYNYRRYDPYVRLGEALDVERAVSVYVRFYPLLQKAYRELGYPTGYFNDRLIEVLEHLLATPDPPRPVQVVRPGVLYTFVDPRLEALSAGQKILIRMGGDNAGKIKAKLREIRDALAALPGEPG